MQKRWISNKGSTLPMVLAVLIIVVIFSVTALTFGSASIKQAEIQEKRVQAYYLARSGANAMVSFIEKNPDAMTTLLGIMGTGDEISSNSVSLNSDSITLDDDENIEITIEKSSDDSLIISSKGEVDSIFRTVSVNIGVETTEGTGPGMVLNSIIYSANGGAIRPNAVVNGPVTSYGDIQDYNKEVNLPEKPDLSAVVIPSPSPSPAYTTLTQDNLLLNISNSTHTFSENRYYSDNNGIYAQESHLVFNTSVDRVIRVKKLDFSGTNTISTTGGAGSVFLYIDEDLNNNGPTVINGTLTIALGDNDINIITRQFTCGNINITRGEGKKGVVRIFILNKLAVGQSALINYPFYNEPGISDLINIYYMGNEFSVGNNVNMSAMLFASQNTNMVFNGNNLVFQGGIFSNGNEVVFNGDSSSLTKTIIYVPDGKVQYSFNNHIFTGSIVANTIELNKGDFTFEKMVVNENFISGSGGGGTTEPVTTYTIGQWQ
ncbi:MAG: hypothetical protein KBA53_13365 [Thermoclostridium sp.]|nr:hypothetical protein [Thermoclostridium sp.]